MTPWVRRLIVANIVMFGLQNFVPGFTQNLELLPAVALYRPWTLITYMFLHDPHSIMHILFNMLTLYWFGGRVEERLGGRNFITMYLLSGIGGGLLSFVFAPSIPIIGASGAIMGVMVAYAKYWPREKIYVFGVLPLEAWMLVTAYVIFDLAGFGTNVAHFAHLGGLATGFLYLLWVDWRSPARAWRKKAIGPAAPRPLRDGDQLRKWREIRLDDLHQINREEVVRLLQKAQVGGSKSLTTEERATLNRFAGIS